MAQDNESQFGGTSTADTPADDGGDTEYSLGPFSFSDELTKAFLEGAKPPGGDDPDNRYLIPEMITGENPWDPAIPTLTPEELSIWGWEKSAEGVNQFKRVPQYKSDDPVRFLNSMNSAELAALEMRLSAAGYIDPDNVQGTGYRSSMMIGAFTNLLIESDRNREDWVGFLDYRVENPVGGGDQGAPDPAYPGLTYLAPDYATLAAKGKAYMRNQLGREASTAEMNMLTGFMSRADKKQWQANELAPDKIGWEKRQRASEGETQGTTQLQGYDANARFDTFFNDKYEAELEHRDRVDKTQARSQNLFASLDELSRST